jgi:hypothetical protein
MELHIVTPSYIDSHGRIKWAVRALDSLNRCLNTTYPHVVVDDIPRVSISLPGNRSFELPIPDPTWRDAAPVVYDEPNVALTRRFGNGSISATLKGVREAKKDGADLIFLHLDDNVYVPMMGLLLNYAQDAFANNPELQHLHLAGYPMISDECLPEEGNRSLVDVQEDEVIVSGVSFHPTRTDEYTLWSAPFSQTMHNDEFWPIVGWSSVFRVEFLEWLLTRDGVRELPHLGAWEQFYRQKTNWKQVIDYGGKLGYINMQFGGLEMHHNENWRELLQYPNDRIT